MPRFLLVLLCITLFAGCLGKRVPEFAPRRTPTPEHLAATKSEDCRSCHDIKPLRHHAVQDDCLHCHHICRECPQ